MPTKFLLLGGGGLLGFLGRGGGGWKCQFFYWDFSDKSQYIKSRRALKSQSARKIAAESPLNLLKILVEIATEIGAIALWVSKVVQQLASATTSMREPRQPIPLNLGGELRGPAATLFISRDTCSDSIA